MTNRPSHTGPIELTEPSGSRRTAEPEGIVYSAAMPDSVLVDTQTALDWISRGREGDMFVVRKKSSTWYYVERFRKAG